ncbi:hypothetical protein [Rothia nasimurium]|uniref:hypothetical protein n=1 Tax=Rothia nasimurium TaxID=85336 RepID=UPI003BA37D2D
MTYFYSKATESPTSNGFTVWIEHTPEFTGSPKIAACAQRAITTARPWLDLPASARSKAKSGLIRSGFVYPTDPDNPQNPQFNPNHLLTGVRYIYNHIPNQ